VEGKIKKCEKGVVRKIPTARRCVSHGVGRAWNMCEARQVAVGSLMEGKEAEKVAGDRV